MPKTKINLVDPMEEAQAVIRVLNKKVNGLEQELKTAQRFHDLVVKERDLERIRNDRLQDALESAKGTLEMIMADDTFRELFPWVGETLRLLSKVKKG